MYAKMDGQRVTTTSDHAESLDDILRRGVRGDPDVSAISTLGKNKLCVMAWHYHDDIVPGPDSAVSLNIAGLPDNLTSAKVTHYRIDETHSNAYTAWKKMGSPDKPTPDQYAQLEKAGQLETLETAAPTVAVSHGAAQLNFTLPRESVSLVVLEWN
jgi:xylan 1,4-beta-xylosidase